MKPRQLNTLSRNSLLSPWFLLIASRFSTRLVDAVVSNARLRNVRSTATSAFVPAGTAACGEELEGDAVSVVAHPAALMVAQGDDFAKRRAALGFDEGALEREIADGAGDLIAIGAHE